MTLIGSREADELDRIAESHETAAQDTVKHRWPAMASDAFYSAGFERGEDAREEPKAIP